MQYKRTEFFFFFLIIFNKILHRYTTDFMTIDNHLCRQYVKKIVENCMLINILLRLKMFLEFSSSIFVFRHNKIMSIKNKLRTNFFF